MTAPDQQPADGGSVQVLRKSAAILDCFSATNPRLRAAEIAAATGMPTSTVARILRTLVTENLLQRQGAVYSIGLRVTSWSAAANAGSDLIATAGPLIALLRDRCGESCGIYVRQGASRVSVLQQESTKSIIYRGYVGQVMPLHAGAAGKVFMAYEPEALQAALDEGLTGFTEHTVIDPHVLDKQLEVVRENGWAFSEEEREPGLNSLAAPVYGPGNAVIASVAVGGPSFRVTRSASEAMAELVTECAAAISRGLLGSGE
ncbi:IclR family transcriptional regulator [Amycolatopsis sp. K13G38]|uniref:IclR family transcriptional regulator n=1 Tax=Amycolatopsis acididurans TaxID=2724524 RepID=A0ABX1J3C3_9PSEU|nr:IclR family transcriptional regulator [Amycolatopsis acididurans]NKQ52855.1 IclR family transcriptional regulator [Amycolatopsis acididurans]